MIQLSRQHKPRDFVIRVLDGMEMQRERISFVKCWIHIYDDILNGEWKYQQIRWRTNLIYNIVMENNWK